MTTIEQFFVNDTIYQMVDRGPDPKEYFPSTTRYICKVNDEIITSTDGIEYARFRLLEQAKTQVEGLLEDAEAAYKRLVRMQILMDAHSPTLSMTENSFK